MHTDAQAVEGVSGEWLGVYIYQNLSFERNINFDPIFSTRNFILLKSKSN